MERNAAVDEFETARREWERAFEQVPDGALGYLKAGDDYSLGGLQVHVNWVLAHYRRVLAGIIAAKFGDVGPQDPPGAEGEARQAAKGAMTPGERPHSLKTMDTLHREVVKAVSRLSESDWARKAPVVYGDGQSPFPTSPEDIVGWLTDHYREHVGQSADLTREWEATRS
jgi:hypothetical protein